MVVHSDQKPSKNHLHSGSLKQALRHSNNCIPVLPLADVPQLIHNHCASCLSHLVDGHGHGAIGSMDYDSNNNVFFRYK